MAQKESKAARTHLENLLTRSLLPKIDSVLRRKLGALPLTNEEDDTAERARGLAISALIPRLYDARERKDAPKDLLQLADDLAAQAFAEILDETHGERRRLRQKLLLILQTDTTRFFLEQDESGCWWMGHLTGTEKTDSTRWRHLQKSPATTIGQLAPSLDPRYEGHLAELLTKLLTWVGHRVPLEGVLGVFATLMGLSEDVSETATPPVESSLAQKIEAGFLLRQLWEAILTLPVRQRIILLLRLRNAEGASLLTCLTQQGIATEEQIAQALEIGTKSYALLARELPCDDLRIAELLKTTSESVGYLRHVARAKLLAGLSVWGER